MKTANTTLLNFVTEWKVLTSFYDYKTMKARKFLLYKVTYKGLTYEVRLDGDLLLENATFDVAMKVYNNL